MKLNILIEKGNLENIIMNFLYFWYRESKETADAVFANKVEEIFRQLMLFVTVNIGNVFQFYIVSVESLSFTRSYELNKIFWVFYVGTLLQVHQLLSL